MCLTKSISTLLYIIILNCESLRDFTRTDGVTNCMKNTDGHVSQNATFSNTHIVFTDFTDNSNMSQIFNKSPNNLATVINPKCASLKDVTERLNLCCDILRRFQNNKKCKTLFPRAFKSIVHTIPYRARYLCSHAHSAARPSARAKIVYIVYKGGG